MSIWLGKQLSLTAGHSWFGGSDCREGFSPSQASEHASEYKPALLAVFLPAHQVALRILLGSRWHIQDTWWVLVPHTPHRNPQLMLTSSRSTNELSNKGIWRKHAAQNYKDIFTYFFFFADRVSLCTPGLELTVPPVCASLMLGLKCHRVWSSRRYFKNIQSWF